MPVAKTPAFHFHLLFGRSRLLTALVATVFAGGPSGAFGQGFPIFNGTDHSCVGAFLDSGGEGASGYGNNENYTYTLCPDALGGAISLSFITFNLSTAGAAPIDGMSIYDGDNISAPLLGTWTGTSLQGQVVSATGGNPTGCLTVVFRSNNAGTGVFAATISCYQPCARPTAVATTGSITALKICPGEAVTFNSGGSYAAAGFNIVSRHWDFGDGTVLNNAPVSVNHTYTQPGGYTAQLYLEDNNGCVSTNRVDILTLVGTTPTFTGTTGITGCSGETLCLDGVVTPTTWNELPGSDLGAGVFLPDVVGACFNATLDFDQFAPGQTLTNINQLLGICVSMEHSFMGDLIISIISPTGESVIMHSQGGLGTYLGIPVDNEGTPNIQGTCWEYCWSPSATNGTWAANSGGTLPSGTYESLNPLTGLLGSQLNGTWTFQVCDMFGLDNGFVCDWGLDFAPALYPDLLEFTPAYGAGCDSSSWSGPNITSTTNSCNHICTAGLSPGDHPYLYTVSDNFGCTYDTTVMITIVPDLQVDAGTDVSTCGTPVQLAATTTGGLDVACDFELWLYDSYGDGWTATSYLTVTIDGVSTNWTLTGGGAGSTPISVPIGSTITLNYHGQGFFATEQSFALINGSGVSVFAADNPANGVVWSGTGDCPGGALVYSWSPTAGLSDASIANPIATVANTTQYCVTVSQAGHPNCVATDCVTVTVDNPVDAGTDGSITVCGNGSAFSLFGELGGTPTTGGTWADPSGTAHGNTFTPGTDIDGIYTYTVVGAGACASSTSTSTVTVTVNTPTDAGANGSIALCSSGAAVSLFAQLGGTPDAGGTWSGPSNVNGGMINPATMNAGTYTYTVAGAPPCTDASTNITVTINAPPNAGADGSITLCSSGAAVSLFAQLGGSPNAGGTWSGPSNVNGGMFNPANMSAGAYVYTVSGTAPCTVETATVNVSINTPPNAGNDGSIALCSSGAAVSLFAQLGGTPDAGGTWSGPSNVNGGMINPATMSAGTYTYTLAGAAPCTDASANVTVMISSPPNAGADGVVTLCSSGAAVSLFAQLGGSPDAGGTWSGPSNVNGGMINPANMSAGAYVYTVSGTAPCTVETATVNVSINTPPNAGTDGSIALCSSGAAVSLFAQLGGTPDAGGTWSGPSNVNGGMINPATMNAGTYTYTVAGAAPCTDVSANVTVTISMPPDAGSDGSITLCSSGAAVSLFAQLGGSPDAGGTWNGPSNANGGMINPANMSAGAYVYTVSGTTPCTVETATVSVTINAPPNAGTDGSIALCSSGATVSLFAQLGGTPDAGGTWSGPSNVNGGMINPATMNAGTYTYTVAGATSCADASANVTVTISMPPNAGADGSITLCTSGAAVSLFAQLGGTPDAGGTWSGPSNVNGGMINPANMSAGAYVYTVSATAPCTVETATVNVTINAPPNAGNDGALTLCISSPASGLFAALGGSPDAGGTWAGPSAVVGGQFNPATMNVGDYTYAVAGSAPCPADVATVSVAVLATPDAGSPGNISLCSSDAAINLFAQLGGTPDAGGTWTGPSAVVGGQFDPASMTAGVYTYTINVPPPCVNVSSTVTVAVQAPPFAGINGALTLCISSPASDLFAALGGTPDAAGSWSGPSAITGGSFDPATMNAGDYTYTVAGVSPCPADVATVSVAVLATPDAGSPGNISLCSSDAAINLFAQLGGTPDAGGAWTGPSAVVGGQFDPAMMTAGDYTYTINVPPPCVDAVSTVAVVVQTPPDAGNDGALTLCISSPASGLFAALGGSPDAGGTWAGPSAVVGGQFNPATMNVGDYTYTVSGNAPCPADVATVSVAVLATPDAGSPGNISLCSSDAAINLFAQLGGTPDAGGAWTGPSVVVGGQFDPASMSAGVYTYTISVPPPCVDAVSTVAVVVQTPPDAGNDGALTLCISSPASGLFAALGGSPDAGGTWTGPSAVVGGQFNPATMNVGDYTYTVAGVSPCPADVATVSVAVLATPDAGSPGNVSLCSSDAAINLFAQLGGTPDAGGAWTGPSAVTGGSFDPASMTAGVYMYTITVPPPCVNVSSSVTVAVQAPPNAGSDGALTLCISSPASDLFAALGGTPDAAGSWSGPSAITGGSFDPSTMSAGDYVYTVAGIAPCPADVATVSVAVLATPYAGSPGNISLCSSDAAINLFAQLGGSPDAGGAWTGPSVVVGGQFDPASMTAGVYTYTITVPPPCVNVSSTVTVAVQAPPFAGSDGSLTLCISSPTSDLFTALNGSPDAGGTWAGPSAITGGSFDPSTMSAGDYVYTVAGVSPCLADVATVSVAVLATPDAGSPGNISLCSSDAAINLFAQLGGSPDAGGAWTGPSVVVGGQFDPASMTAGVYTYTITVPPPCVNVSSTVTVAVQAPPFAGSDGSLTLCISSPTSDLFTALDGSPDAGGTWSGPSLITGGSFDPATMSAGDYVYTVEGTSPCPADVATVSVAVSTAPDPGDDDILNLCASGDPVDLFQALNGADLGGSWTNPSNGSFGGTFIPGTSATGNYTYTIPGIAPCPSVSAVIAVNVVSNADAGGNGSISLCSSANAISLFTLLQGTPDAGGDWLAPDGTAFSGTLNAQSEMAGTYTYVVVVPSPCVNDTAQVQVGVTLAVDAGIDSSITLCSSNPPIDLLAQLGGSPDESGTWSGPGGPSSSSFNPSYSAPGAYTFTVQGTAPCPNATATVTIAVNPMPNAGTDGTLSLCPEAAPANMFASLGGNPDLGGTWTTPGGIPHGNMFDPALDPTGAYTYTVSGTAPCLNDNSTATVNIYFVPAPNAGNDAVSCTFDGLLNATGTWISGHWSGPSGTSIMHSDSASTTVSANTGGAYNFIWSTESAQGCASSDTVRITFTDTITPSVETLETLCNGTCDGTAMATAVGGNLDSSAYVFQWSGGTGGNASTGAGFCAGNYTATALDTNGCAGSIDFTITEPEPLAIDTITSTDALCPGSCDGTILITDPEGTDFSIDNGTTFQSAVSFSGICPGGYSVIMLNANGCSATGTAIVGSAEPVVAGFSLHPDTLFVNATSAAFTNVSSGNATEFLWDFGDGETSTEANPVHVFPAGIAEVYEICLTAMTAANCPDTYCVPLPILDLPAIFLPNAFTPDGDGLNDVFRVSGFGITAHDFHFMIFNRWGAKIFDTTDPSAAWDGKLNGSVVKSDVYVWKVTATFFNTIEPYEATGHVTLLK